MLLKLKIFHMKKKKKLVSSETDETSNQFKVEKHCHHTLSLHGKKIFYEAGPRRSPIPKKIEQDNDGVFTYSTHNEALRTGVIFY